MMTQQEHDIAQELIADGICDNGFRAQAIVKGCELARVETKDARLARARLYRDWRNSKIYAAHTAPCFEMAIKGEPVPQQALIPEALHVKCDDVVENLGYMAEGLRRGVDESEDEDDYGYAQQKNFD